MIDDLHPALSDPTPAPGFGRPATGSARMASSVVTAVAPGSPASESVGALRSHLLAQHLRDGRRALTVCGATAGVGVTWLSVNLAVAMAQAGVRTLLIDANLRAPGVGAMIDTGAGPGLRQVLLGEATLRDAIVRDVIPDLSILQAGGAEGEGAQELLASEGFKALTDDCLRDYELTIADTPPSGQSADARRIASTLRHALLVVRRNHSFVVDAERLSEELAADRATLIGSFLNDY